MHFRFRGGGRGNGGAQLRSAAASAMLPALRRCWAALRPGPFPGAVLVPARGRKTRDDPPAKSKAGRIKVPPPVDPAELLVVQERYSQYYRVLRALRCGRRRGRGLGCRYRGGGAWAAVTQGAGPEGGGGVQGCCNRCGPRRSEFRVEAGKKKRELLQEQEQQVTTDIQESLLAWNDTENERQWRRR